MTNSLLACRKCGSDDISVRWHSNGGRYRDGGCGYHAKVLDVSEHLHYTCRCCGYEWTGATADA